MRSRVIRAIGVALVCSATIVAIAVPANAAPSINVSPGGPYANGAQVAITADGFTPGAFVLVAECKGAGPITDPRVCADPATGASAVAVVDSGGKVNASLKVVTGQIRPGVSCTGTDCVLTVINVGKPTTENAFVKLGTTTGTGSIAPTAAPSTAPSSVATNPVVPVNPAPSALVPTPLVTPVAPVVVGNGAPAGKPAKVRTALPHTGADDATHSLLAGIVVLQLGLIFVVRTTRKRRRSAL